MKTYKCKYPDPANPKKFITQIFQAANINEAAKIAEIIVGDFGYWVEEVIPKPEGPENSTHTC